MEIEKRNLDKDVIKRIKEDSLSNRGFFIGYDTFCLMFSYFYYNKKLSSKWNKIRFKDEWTLSSSGGTVS